ncbi:glycosyltransferase [Jannaschia rubra]|uniref:GDP-mannose-dependent alpha-(1-6)-phosphatidylinositol monomannoside mannosyltransferase n=1 Tax=Jannaschia rubra TaxID=282197 RepID=A0A0M6XUK8_9RHOB|nr:glycosyltransferase [Jannaschia rubra]CTQ34790.1 GDP-mannose-dependent alpha-(1-6)-phosphatidylinositol monomannoside mannosyltransferase [Jannaschia rubra]SFG80420.1 Glycosyltransferase involved in cell wall bisynthesis [Jannaschia rubra]
MKLLVVVSEFPKLTETFAYRNVVEYGRLGHDARIFHVKPFRDREIVHGFVRDLLPRAFTFPYLGARTLGALAAETFRRPGTMARLIGRLLAAHRREPRRGMAVAALFPKAVALGRWCRRNGVEHIHAEFAGHPANAALIAATLADVPFSFSAHANDIFVSQALLPEKARAAAFVRAISAYNVRWLTALPGFPADKLRLIRCGVARETLDAPLPDLPGPEGLRILYVGSLLRKKGVAHLLDALAALPADMAWTARILGGGDLSETLKAQADRLGLTDRVRFDGPQPAETVALAYRDAHVLVVPSIPGDGGRVEGIPVVLMEAMAHGRAVVASDLSGIPELVEPGRTGWLTPPGDARAIAAALTAIARDPGAAFAIARAGRDRIAAEYLVEDNAAALARLMEGARA